MEDKKDFYEILHYIPREDGSHFGIVNLRLRACGLSQKSKALVSAMESESSDNFSDPDTLDGIASFMNDLSNELCRLRNDIHALERFVSDKCEEKPESE